MDNQRLNEARAYCNNVYKSVYDEEFAKATGSEAERSRKAQKTAIQQSLYQAILAFPEIDSCILWNAIYGAHVHRKTAIDDLAIIETVISAAQSWKKSSGHAFEEFIQRHASEALANDNIELILQRDLDIDSLDNAQQDKTWLKDRIDNSTFDLFAIVNADGQRKCFGCVQSKTSIRDRVTRDREPSIMAMNEFFWSVCITLDGTFLEMPKFKAMVNGKTQEFPINGWHGMYVLSEISPNDRIYPIDLSFELFRKHALQASTQWLQQRQWFNHKWKAVEQAN